MDIFPIYFEDIIGLSSGFSLAALGFELRAYATLPAFFIKIFF
jgi:hypothetical protein